MSDEEMDVTALVSAIYERKTADGWSTAEAADLCDWLLFVKPVSGEPRHVTQMRAIRETCANHGMMDLLEAEEQAARAEWAAALANTQPVEVLA